MTIPQMTALAKDHWKVTNPEVYRRMVDNNDLEKEAAAAARLTLMEMQTLMKGGLSETEAWQASRELFILATPEAIAREYNV